jgi:hypothetical protein
MWQAVVSPMMSSEELPLDVRQLGRRLDDEIRVASRVCENRRIPGHHVTAHRKLELADRGMCTDTQSAYHITHGYEALSGELWVFRKAWPGGLFARTAGHETPGLFARFDRAGDLAGVCRGV